MKPLINLFWLITIAVVPVAASQASSPQSESSRALTNYRLLMGGQISWGNLSSGEQEEVKELARWIRSQTTPKEEDNERCWRRETKRSSRDLTELALRLIELRCGPRIGREP